MDRKLNWLTYWVGVAFVTFCLGLTLFSFAASQPAKCRVELEYAKKTCRANGRSSYLCGKAVDDYKLCMSTSSDDPIGGLSSIPVATREVCTTRCIKDYWGNMVCRTVCRNRA